MRREADALAAKDNHGVSRAAVGNPAARTFMMMVGEICTDHAVSAIAFFAAQRLSLVFASAPCRRTRSQKRSWSCKPKCSSCWTWCSGCSRRWTRSLACCSTWRSRLPTANQMTATVNALQQKLNTENDAASGKLDAVSGQVQSLNDSVDELKARIAKLDKSIQDLQTQLQNYADASRCPRQFRAQRQASGQLRERHAGRWPRQRDIVLQGAADGVTGWRHDARGSSRCAGAAAAGDLSGRREGFQRGARTQLARGEFQDVVHYYPLDDLAGTAQFYLGEIAYQQQNYSDAVNFYTAVLDGLQRQRQGSGGATAQGIGTADDE